MIYNIFKTPPGQGLELEQDFCFWSCMNTMDTLILQAPTSPQHWMVDLEGGGGVLREAIIIDEGPDL